MAQPFYGPHDHPNLATVREDRSKVEMELIEYLELKREAEETLSSLPHYASLCTQLHTQYQGRRKASERKLRRIRAKLAFHRILRNAARVEGLRRDEAAEEAAHGRHATDEYQICLVIALLMDEERVAKEELEEDDAVIPGLRQWRDDIMQRESLLMEREALESVAN